MTHCLIRFLVECDDHSNKTICIANLISKILSENELPDLGSGSQEHVNGASHEPTRFFLLTHFPNSQIVLDGRNARYPLGDCACLLDLCGIGNGARQRDAVASGANCN
jgi:hypothetical protein